MNIENGNESRSNTRETGSIKLEKILEGIASLRGEMASMNSELKSELKSEIVAVRHEMADVKNEMAAVKGEVAGIKSEVAGIKSELTVLRSDSKREMAEFRTEVGKNFEAFYWRAFMMVSFTLHNTY